MVDEVPPTVEDLAVRHRPLRKQPEDAATERRLAAAGLADETENLARTDVERDAVDRSNGATQRAVVDAQIAHGDDRLRLSRRLVRSVGEDVAVDVDVGDRPLAQHRD